MRVGVLHDLGHLRAGLRADDDLHAVVVEIHNGVESSRRIEMRIPNEQAKLFFARCLCFNLRGGDFKRSNSVLAESRPSVTQDGEHADLHWLRGRLKFSGGTN